ncbi:MAG: MFS transporter [Paracoccaceae bacterium]
MQAAAADRWLLLAGVWLIYLMFGLVTAGLAPLVGSISADLAMGPGAMGMVMGTWPLAYVVASLPGGALLDRIGTRRGVLLAVGLMILSTLWRAVAGGPWSMTAAVALFGLGGPLISVGAPKLIARLFQGRARGLAMGIYITGPYLGGVLALGLTNGFLLPLVGGSWRGVMFVHAGLIAGSGLVWLALSRRPAIREMTAPQGPGAAIPPPMQVLRGLAASSEVRRILAMAISIFTMIHALNNWLPTLLEAKGMDPAAAGWWSAMPTAVGVVAALILPRLAEKRLLAMMAGLAVSMLLATLLLHLPPGLWLASGLVAQGVARGTMMTVAMMLLMDSRDVPVDRLGLAGGLFFSVAQLGGALGPALFGLLRQASGGFDLPLMLLSALCCLLLVQVARMRRLRLSRSGNPATAP